MQGTAEFNHEDFEQTRAAEQDQKLLVKFYYKTVKDQDASEEQGRAVFKEREYVDIRIPGARGTGAARPATARDKKRFERHYQAFKQRIELPVEGTPLAEWPMVNRAMAEELSFAGIKTVEQLAGMADVVASQFMGGQMFKDKAQKWLDRATADVTVTQLEGELHKRDTIIAQMEKRLAELEKPKRKRRTREEIDRDNELSDTGERSAEPSGFGGGTDAGS